MAVKPIKSTITTVLTVIMLSHIVRSGTISATCKHPGEPVNGESIPDKYEYSTGEKITFKCSQSLILIGEEEAECLGNNTWSSPVPSCGWNVGLNKQTEYVEEPENIDLKPFSVVTDNNFETCLSINEEMTLIHHFHKKINVTHVDVYIKENSTTSYNIRVEIIRCDAKTSCHLERIDNDSTLKKYTCGSSTDPQSAETIQFTFPSTVALELCEITAVSHSVSGIKQNSCGTPEIPANGEIKPDNVDKYSDGQEVTIKCNQAHLLDGPSKNKCVQGSWNSSGSYCDKNLLLNQTFEIQAQNITKYLVNFTDGDTSSGSKLVLNNNKTVFINLMGTYVIDMLIFTMNLNDIYNMSVKGNYLYIEIETGNQTEFRSCKSVFYNNDDWINDTIKFTCEENSISCSTIRLTLVGNSETPTLVNLREFQILTTQTHWEPKRHCKVKEHSPNCVAKEMFDSDGIQYVLYFAKRNYSLYGKRFTQCLNGTWTIKPPCCIDGSLHLQTSQKNETYKTWSIVSTLICIVLVICAIILVGTKRISWGNQKNVTCERPEDLSNGNSYEEIHNEIYEASTLERPVP